MLVSAPQKKENSSEKLLDKRAPAQHSRARARARDQSGLNLSYDFHYYCMQVF